MTTDRATLRLLAWLSPAFPTGAYAYSHGLEWAIECRDISNAATLQSWLDDILMHGAGWSDAILMRHAHAAAHDPATLEEIARRGVAACPSRERRTETLDQGAAFIAAAAPWQPHILRGLGTGVPYPVAVGALAGAAGIAVDAVAAGAAQAFTANLISAAVRLVPLGQSDGLRVLAALEGTILRLVEESRDATLDDLGGCCFRADIAAMRHETQYTRLFRT